MISIFLKHPMHLKTYQIFLNILYNRPSPSAKSFVSWFLDTTLSVYQLKLCTKLQRSVFLSSRYPFGLLFMLLLLLFCFIVLLIVLIVIVPLFIMLTLLIAILQSWRVPFLHLTHLILATHLHK